MSVPVPGKSFEEVATRIEQETGELSIREWVLLLAIGLVSIVFLWVSTLIPSTSSWRAVVTALGTGLLVSAVFSFVQTRITARATRRGQAKYLAAFSEVLAAEVREQMAQLRDDLPTDDLPSSSRPDPKFNEILMHDLKGAPYYWFRGYSARFLAARLRSGSAPACQVYVILPDPISRDSLDLRLSYLAKSTEDGYHVDQEKVRAKVYGDLQQGLAGLFLARHEVGSIELIFTRTPGLDRFELLSEALWITLFSGEQESATFPRTLRYNRNSTIYRMHVSECNQIRESPYVRRFGINRHLDEPGFRKMFKEITGEDLSGQLWTELRDQFVEFERDFLRTASIAKGKNVRIG